MHASALAQMKLCVDTHLKRSRHYVVVDLGSRIPPEQEHSHRDVLAGYDIDYVGVDILDGPNVDRVMTKPYSIPVKSNSADVVLSGQAFEHIPFFWATFLEMARITKPGGLIFITAPSRGHAHDLQDCWRYYPDGMRALAAFSRMRLKEAFTDYPPRRPEGNGRRFAYGEIDDVHYYWGDTVGVFQKPKKYSKLVGVARVVIVWWANRVGGLDAVPRPERVVNRRRILHRRGDRTR